MKTLRLKIPFPPTVNHLWARTGKRTYLSKEYRSFLALVAAEIRLAPGAREIGNANAYAVELTVYPPDRRPRDLDNFFKAALDAVTRAGLWQDDSRVCKLVAYKGVPAEKPFAILEITPLERSVVTRNPEFYGERARRYKK